MAGAQQALGIGQTHTVERYDPATATFDGFGCLDTKRMYPQAIELDSGRVYISGNWYHDDAIEMFDGKSQFLPVKAVTVQRARPYMFRTASDDAIIMGTINTHGDTVADPAIADRVKGPALRIPLLAQWPPQLLHVPHADCDAFIGDEQAGSYASLMPVQHADGRVAMAVVDSGSVQLLTSTIAPAEARGHAVHYFSGVIVDRQARRAYLAGIDDDRRFYFFCHDLLPSADGHRLLPIVGRNCTRLYFTDPLPAAGTGQPLLTPDGHIVMAGGTVSDNYSPVATVYCFCVGQQTPLFAQPPHHAMAEWLWWLFVVLALLLLAGLGWMAWRLWRPKPATQPQTTKLTNSQTHKLTETAPAAATDDELMQRLNLLMDEQKPYLNADLKVADVAQVLHVKSRQLSDCIKAQCGMTFPQFVNKLRIDYAMQLLLQHPDMKVSVVGTESGFANDQSFFRAFKLATGKTPTEWRAD